MGVRQRGGSHSVGRETLRTLDNVAGTPMLLG